MDQLTVEAKLQIENKVHDIVAEILTADSTERAFSGFLVRTQEATKQSHVSKLHPVLWFFQQQLPQTPESQDVAIKSFVSCIHAQSYNVTGSELLFSVLETLVEKNIVPARLVCEAVLTCDKLVHQNSVKWCQAFQLVRRIVGGVDYKGCRDILRMLLERTQSIPAVDNVVCVQAVEAIYNVVSYILDRNACLLPSYFAVNEVTKLYADDRPCPHWRIGQLLGHFVETFRPAAQMVSICGRSQLVPVVGQSSCSLNVWRLNPTTLRFMLSGPLPYDKELYEPQTGLLRYILQQAYSREMVTSVLNLNKQSKQRCTVLEDQLVDLVVHAMEQTEEDCFPSDDCLANDESEQMTSIHLWQHLSGQLIFFLLFQFASFPYVVNLLYDKLRGRNLSKGRDYLMWILLQFISGSIQKNPLEDFLPIMKLYDLLYPETEPLPLPDITQSSCTIKMAVTSIWIHVNKKAQQDKVTLQRPIPQALSGHVEFLKQCLGNKSLTMSDYRIILLCNAYSTNSELFAPPMGILVEGIYGNNQKSISLPGNVQALTPIQPLSMNVLDSLTVHAKMSLIHSIVTRIMKLAQTKLTSLSLAPALVETYSRLLVYTEIESLGIKGFISQLLPSVFKSNAWGILHTLLEMFSYRLHHMQPHYRIQLLSQLHQLSQSPLLNQYQLYLCVENTALHLIMGLGSWEVQPQLTRVVSETKSGILLSNDSEELNRAMVLILARTVSVQGLESISSIWCKEILTNIMTATPLSWPSYSTACFPPAIAEFFQQQVHQQREDKQSLKRKVEGEYRVWKSCMAAENDLITHFATQGIPLFFCVLWKTLQEDNRIAPTAYKVLERLGPRAMAAHLRMFADFLICEFSMSTANQHVNRLLDTLNDLIWKWCIIPIDRLVLCLTLRNVEDNEASVCCFIMFCLLNRCQEFRSRVQDFVKENSPDHWLQSNWYDKHVAFHKKYPEKYYFEMVPEMAQQPQHQCLPVFFGNVCLRFIPVFDLVIHRFIELPPIAKHIETLLDSLGGLYKFHDRPLTYLYNTLHYYDRRLQERTNLKRKLVQAIVGSFKEIKPSNWCLTEDFMQYLEQVSDDWSPDSEYYLNLIGRLVDTISGLPVFPACDWRFNEFPNAAAHGLYVTSIELMALPVNGPVVGNALYDVVFKGIMKIPREKIFSWLNAVGMVITTLPECYWIVLYDRIVRVLQDGQLAEPSLTCDPFQMFNFSKGHQVIGELDCGYLLALCHAVWVHTSIGQISTLIPFMKERLKPIVKTEEQLLYVCHLFGPFLQRFHVERTRCVLDFTLELYEMLSNVDKAVEHMRYIDPISDFLYHIKYMFVGDGVKNEVEKIIRTLRPSLQLRLRFIAHHSKDESTAISQPPVVTSS